MANPSDRISNNGFCETVSIPKDIGREIGDRVGDRDLGKARLTVTVFRKERPCLREAYRAEINASMESARRKVGSTWNINMAIGVRWNGTGSTSGRDGHGQHHCLE